MLVDDELINYLEKLSQLKLLNEERKQAKEDLGCIIDYMDKLTEVDIEDTMELVPHLPQYCYLRDDKVMDSYDRKEMLSNASLKTDEYFLVPRKF